MNPLEKIKLGKQYKDLYNQAMIETNPLKKIKIVKEAKEILIKLGVSVKAKTEQETTTSTPTFDALARGDYDGFDVDAYIEKLRTAFDEINELEPLKEPAIRFVEGKAGKAITESIRSEIFNELIAESDDEDDDEWFVDFDEDEPDDEIEEAVQQFISKIGSKQKAKLLLEQHC